jgi:hypothetical protein
MSKPTVSSHSEASTVELSDEGGSSSEDSQDGPSRQPLATLPEEEVWSSLFDWVAVANSASLV